MRSPAPKQAESEFDDLLGQLTDELAMTPASESAVSLVPDLEPPKAHVEATSKMAAEAAAAAGVLQPVVVSKPDNTIVKVVAIIATSLTVVSVAALVMFGQAKPGAEPAAVVDDAAVGQAERDAEREAAERRAEQEAHERAVQAERDAEQAEVARIEAARLKAQLAAQAESKPKPRKPRPKRPPKPPGDDFESL